MDVDFGRLPVQVSQGNSLAKGSEFEHVQRPRFERTCEGILASILLRK